MENTNSPLDDPNFDDPNFYESQRDLSSDHYQNPIGLDHIPLDELDGVNFGTFDKNQVNLDPNALDHGQHVPFDQTFNAEQIQDPFLAQQNDNFEDSPQGENPHFPNDHDFAGFEPNDFIQDYQLQDQFYTQEQNGGISPDQYIFPASTFDLSKVTVASLITAEPEYIENVFAALAKKDPASQVRFMEHIGLDLSDDNNIRLLAGLNETQIYNATIDGVNAIHNNNVGISQLEQTYPTADQKLYLSDQHPDFHRSKESNPFDAVQVGQRAVFDPASGIFIDQPFYALSLKGASPENAQNFISSRIYDVDMLLEESKGLNESINLLIKDRQNSNNTYFLKEDSEFSIAQMELAVYDTAKVCNITGDELELTRKTMKYSVTEATPDRTGVHVTEKQIDYLEFNPDLLSPYILSEIDDGYPGASLLNGSLLIREHIGEDRYLAYKSNDQARSAENDTSNEHGDDDLADKPKNKANIGADVPTDEPAKNNREQLSAAALASASIDELDTEKNDKSFELQKYNRNGQPRTAADELASLIAKSVMLMAEVIKKIIKLMVEMIRSMFGKDDPNSAPMNERLADIWHQPLFKPQQGPRVFNGEPEPNDNSNNLVEPNNNTEDLTDIEIDSSFPLLVDPFTKELNNARSGLSLEDFDKNIGNVYEMDGKEYLVIDVNNPHNLEEYKDQNSPVIKLICQDDLPQNLVGNEANTLITPFYLKDIKDNLKTFTVDELDAKIQDGTATKLKGPYLQSVAEQYLEQARMYLGATAPYGVNPDSMSQSKLDQYKEQFVDGLKHSREYVGKGMDFFKAKSVSIKDHANNLFKIFKVDPQADSEQKQEGQNYSGHEAEPTQGNVTKMTTDKNSYYEPDAATVEAFNNRHNNVQSKDIEKYVGMVFQDERTDKLMGVLDVAADSKNIGVISVPLDVINSFEGQITEKDALLNLHFAENIEVINLHLVDAYQQIDSLNFKHRIDPEFIAKMIDETKNNTVDIYAEQTKRIREHSEQRHQAKLDAVGTLLTTDKGQYVALFIDHEQKHSMHPVFHAVKITDPQKQMTGEDIQHNGVVQIDYMDVRTFSKYQSMSGEMDGQTSYLDPDVHSALLASVERGNEAEMLQYLNTVQANNKHHYDQNNAVDVAINEEIVKSKLTAEINEKQKFISAINIQTALIENKTLQEIVRNVKDTLTDPDNSNLDFFTTQFKAHEDRMRQLNIGLLSATDNLNKLPEIEKLMLDPEIKKVELSTLYGSTKVVDFNQHADLIKELSNDEKISDSIDQFYGVVSDIGAVAIATQKIHGELLVDGFVDGVNSKLKMHKLSDLDLNNIKKVSDLLNDNFKNTGSEFEQFEPLLNHSTANIKEVIENEKVSIKEILTVLNDSVEMQHKRNNDHSNDQNPNNY